MPISPIERMPMLGFAAVVEEDAMVNSGRRERRGNSRFIESFGYWPSRAVSKCRSQGSLGLAPHKEGKSNIGHGLFFMWRLYNRVSRNPLRSGTHTEQTGQKEIN